QRLRRAEQLGPFLDEHLPRFHPFHRGRRRRLLRRRRLPATTGGEAGYGDAREEETEPSAAAKGKCPHSFSPAVWIPPPGAAPSLRTLRVTGAVLIIPCGSSGADERRIKSPLCSPVSFSLNPPPPEELRR